MLNNFICTYQLYILEKQEKKRKKLGGDIVCRLPEAQPLTYGHV